MSSDEWTGEEPKKSKSSKRKESSKSKSKSKSNRKPVAEAASGWSNDVDGEDDNVNGPNIPASQLSIMRQNSRRGAEDTLTIDIPTISRDDVEGEDANDAPPQDAVTPKFSVNQIASFQEIQNEFTRQRANQHIDSKIDIAILYNNLHLQEELDTENQLVWDWDKVFVEIRKAITTPVNHS
ncbi:unnamed protein product [Adineta ricciae]|uniref:Uncharacterized protein n=1 Tax=Adineta ricciae TaxID=249248 RepID=A0A814UDJ4_ADIRI|nr:unnamed protein product [Adineta ricciae]